MTAIIIKYWVEFAMGVIAAGLTAGFKHLLKRQNEVDMKQKAIGDGVMALLRDRIIQSCNHYRLRGYCPLYGLENIEALYKEYKALGGNGAITTLVEEIHRLPRIERED